jgi:phage shock protein PspC (stress-responsive transcriptional regulator)
MLYWEGVSMEVKRIYRGHNRMFSGVCAGIAEYLRVDVTLIRVVAVILGFGSAGLAVLAYCVCAALIPEAPQG